LSQRLSLLLVNKPHAVFQDDRPVASVSTFLPRLICFSAVCLNAPAERAGDPCDAVIGPFKSSRGIICDVRSFRRMRSLAWRASGLLHVEMLHALPGSRKYVLTRRSCVRDLAQNGLACTILGISARKSRTNGHLRRQWATSSRRGCVTHWLRREKREKRKKKFSRQMYRGLCSASSGIYCALSTSRALASLLN